MSAQEPAQYVAYTSMVAAEERDAYVAHLESACMPVWRSMHEDGLLADRMVLEQTEVASVQDGVPPWSLLHLARIADGVSAEEFLEAESNRLATAGCSPPGQLLRVEVLESTPKSFYPMPVGTAGDEPELQFFIEYINVFEGFLDEYRDSMIINSGPAVGRLVDAGLVVMFIALETRSVTHADASMPRWNQIHVMADPAGAEFPAAAFDRALREVNPDGGGFEEVFGRLDHIRDKPRESINREIASLRVEASPGDR
jgi:hypothetical protein